MTEICFVCYNLMENSFQQPLSINFMLTYIFSHQKRHDQLICGKCYDELKIAFDFMMKFHESRLKELRRITAIAESQNIYVQQPEQSTYSDIPITGAENQFNILTKVDETTEVKNALPNQSESLGLEHTAKDKRIDDEATSTNKTFEQNEATCSTDSDSDSIEYEVSYVPELRGSVENIKLGPPDEKGIQRKFVRHSFTFQRRKTLCWQERRY